MTDLTPGAAPAPSDKLHAELRSLIASSRQRLAGAVNAELTRLYWTVGERLRTEVLGGERAHYGSQLLEQLGQQHSQEFGRGFEARNLRRMVKFAQAFPSAEIVSTLSTQLSWSHLVTIVALKAPEAQQIDATAHREGHAWADMAILCCHHSEMDLCEEVLRQRKLPHQVRRKSYSVFDPAHDSIKVMALHVSGGLTQVRQAPRFRSLEESRNTLRTRQHL